MNLNLLFNRSKTPAPHENCFERYETFSTKNISVLLLAGLNFTGLTQAASITAPSGASNAQLTLNNVSNFNLSATLVALDNGVIHGGQIFKLSGTSPANAAVDAQFSNSDSKVSIPLIAQDALVSYNATLLLTNPATWEFTVVNLTTTSSNNGSPTQVVFNQGPKGDSGAAGPKGDTGAIGPKGDNGATGPKGDSGLAGAKGDPGATGPKGDIGPQGPIGLTGATGPQGPAGANGSGGANSVNGIAQINGDISLTKANISLGNVDNTNDASKPVSTAQQSALDLKANLTSPALSGTPTAPTANAGTNSTQIATTAFVTAAVSGATATHTIGESFGGGKVFYVTPNGLHGLIAANNDQEATGTTAFEAESIVRIPARYDAAGQNYTDWRVPSTYEMFLLYSQRAIVGGFSTGNYLTSYRGWITGNPSISFANFSTGAFPTASGSFATDPTNFLVRAIRSF